MERHGKGGGEGGCYKGQVRSQSCVQCKGCVGKVDGKFVGIRDNVCSSAGMVIRREANRGAVGSRLNLITQVYFVAAC
jgi:hypothetical protein